MSSYATALVGTDGSASSAGEALLETAKARTADLLVHTTGRGATP